MCVCLQDIFNISDVCSNKQNTKRTTDSNIPQSSKKVCINTESDEDAHATNKRPLSFAEKSKLLLERIQKDTYINKQPENNKKAFSSRHLSNKRIVERCFPGPAGLLSPTIDCIGVNSATKYSDLQENLGKSTNEVLTAANSDIRVTVTLFCLHHREFFQILVCNLQDILCSQTSAIAFKSSAWLQAIEDFRIQKDNFMSLADKYNILWIKSKGSKQKLLDQKAPFLAAILQNVQCANAGIPTVTVLLKDATGNFNVVVEVSLIVRVPLTSLALGCKALNLIACFFLYF